MYLVLIATVTGGLHVLSINCNCHGDWGVFMYLVLIATAMGGIHVLSINWTAPGIDCNCHGAIQVVVMDCNCLGG